MNPIRKDMELLSNSMATYAHITDNLESFALFFMLGVCLGLLLALCLLGLGSACRPRHSALPAPDRKRLRESSEEDEEEEEEEEEESEGRRDEEAAAETLGGGESAVSEGGRSDGTLRSVDVFTSADELEKARRLEERERIVREIWRNGQPDILATGTGTLGRVHYH